MPSRSVRFAYVIGIGLVCSGLLHLVVWLVSGTEWTGAVSWRKPILFGLSTGVTVLSVAWVSTKVRPRRGDGPLIFAFAAALAIEVLLITLQQWRDQPSHFNRSTTTDAVILSLIEVLITFATVYIVDLTVRVYGSLNAIPAMQRAIRDGMSLLVLGCLLGFLIAMIGYQSLENGTDPATFGAAGVLKFPHGIPLHAIQFLPLLVALAESQHWPQSTIKSLVRTGTLLTLGFTLFGLLQTFTGRPRFEFWPTSSAVLLLFVIASLTPLLWTSSREKYRPQRNLPRQTDEAR